MDLIPTWETCVRAAKTDASSDRQQPLAQEAHSPNLSPRKDVCVCASVPRTVAVHGQGGWGSGGGHTLYEVELRVGEEELVASFLAGIQDLDSSTLSSSSSSSSSSSNCSVSSSSSSSASPCPDSRPICWKISRRYSDFVALFNDLTVEMSSSVTFTDDMLPPKQWFMTMDKDFVESRRRGLDSLISGLLSTQLPAAAASGEGGEEQHHEEQERQRLALLKSARLHEFFGTPHSALVALGLKREPTPPPRSYLGALNLAG